MDRGPAVWTIYVVYTYLKPPLGEMGRDRFPPAGGCGAYGAAAEAFLNNSHGVALWRAEALPRRMVSLGVRLLELAQGT